MGAIRIVIGGRNYPLKVPDGDEAMMEEISKDINTRLNDFKKRLLNQPESTIFVMTCLSLAEEMYMAKKQNKPSVGIPSLSAKPNFDSIKADLDKLIELVEE